MIRDSIYLSGWEYNRILASSPLESMVSGLPAPVLWQGGAHFWMFKNVYCTSESFQGDFAAYKDLGWTTGYIFDDLRRRGFIKLVDLPDAAKRNPILGEKLLHRHGLLRADYTPEKLNILIENGNETELERIKLYLLRPLLEDLRCVINVSPNSVQSWVDAASRPRSATDTISRALTYLEEPITSQTYCVRAATTLCRPPGTGLPSSAITAQRTVERTVQKPIIADLIMGRLPQSDYHRALQATRSVYQPIDKQLLSDYKRNIGRLEDLRALADAHLWKDLHNEWLPRLEREPQFLEDFKLLLRDALLQARFDPFLEALSNIGIAIAGLAVSSSAGPLAGAVTAASLALAHKRRRDEIKPYAMFYQRALKGDA